MNMDNEKLVPNDTPSGPCILPPKEESKQKIKMCKKCGRFINQVSKQCSCNDNWNY